MSSGARVCVGVVEQSELSRKYVEETAAAVAVVPS